MKKILITATLVFLLQGCMEDTTDSKRILEQTGYTDITFTGISPFACSNDDVYRTGFRAKNAAGNYVSGTVCKGFLKGATIRLD
jgi:hypothetical protein